MEIHRKTMLVDGLVTGYLEAGDGDPVVLLHGGEFGASAEQTAQGSAGEDATPVPVGSILEARGPGRVYTGESIEHDRAAVREDESGPYE